MTNFSGTAKRKTEDRNVLGLSSLVNFRLIVQMHERIGIRSSGKHRQEAEQYKQTHQGRNNNDQNKGHDNLLSRVKNGY